jgi:peptidoglycan/LPS O-acetylase OafA/YrhL
MNEMGAITGPHWPKTFAGISLRRCKFLLRSPRIILVYTYAGRNIVLGEFYQTRFARIYPTYLFSLVLTFPFFYFGPLNMHVPFFYFAEQHFALSAVLVLLLQSRVPQAALSWNAVARTLSVEAFFYAIFPFA